MLKYLKTSFVIMIASLTGCATISSSIHYTQGTECLSAGNYLEAVEHLEKAVQKEPAISKYHNNLASAYLGLGNLEKAWYHSRQAVLCDQPNGPALITFLNLYDEIVKKRGLDQEGTSIEDILFQLGEPDLRIENDDGTVCILYGRCTLKFIENKLINSSVKAGIE